MGCRIEMKLNPPEDDRLAIQGPLRAHNFSQVGDAQAETLALLVHDDHTHQVIGGLYGRLFYRWLFIELLAIPEQVRGQGIGARLMAMAEDVAREKNCVGIWLDTFDFQAPGFYQQLGFAEFGHLEAFPPGHTRFFFQKRLI